MSGRNPRPGDLYKHFKGKLYQITAIAYDAESGERKVVYQALYGDYKTYVRDYNEFVGEVDAVKYPTLVGRYRFESLRPEEADEEDRDGNAHKLQEGLQLSHENAQLSQVVPNQQQTQLSQPAQEQVVAQVNMEPEVAAEPEINPDLLAFLDAKGNDEKIEVLYHIRKRVDENVMSAIEASLDISQSEGDLDDRVMFVRNILATRAKYEGGRLR